MNSNFKGSLLFFTVVCISLAELQAPRRSKRAWKGNYLSLQGKRGQALKMIIPIRCFTCGKRAKVICPKCYSAQAVLNMKNKNNATCSCGHSFEVRCRGCKSKRVTIEAV